MNEYSYLIKYGIVKSASEWDRVVKNNPAEKVDIFWKDKININQVIYNEVQEMKKKGYCVQKNRRLISNMVNRDLSVLEHILSHFVGYKPKIERVTI